MTERIANSDQYIITCEGETEVLYFKHLKSLINMIPNKPQMTAIPEVEVNPEKKAKSIRSQFERTWYHIVDKETCKECDEKTFEKRITSFYNIGKNNKKIETVLGYSNVSFELWLIMHKSDKKPSVHCAENYWKTLKKIYKLNDVESFNDYKSEKNFNKVLAQIELEDIKNAIKRADNLERINNREGILRTSGFPYFENNPSLSVHNVVKMILEDSELI